MLTIVKKNYDTYVNIKKLAEHVGDEAEEEEDDGEEKKGHDFTVIKQLKVENGRNGADFILSLTQGVLIENTAKELIKYFKPYFEQLIAEKHLSKPEYSDGISKVITSLPELIMDYPAVHKLVFDYLIEPLLR